MKYNGAEIITKFIKDYGIKTVSGIPGGANLPIYDAISKSGLKHILARHEQGAAFIAQGQARATGQPAVCFGTSGPGATNLLTGIADAKLDSIPVIAITGQVPLGLIGTDAFQEVDSCSIFKTVTKKTYLAKSPKELLEIIPDAFKTAMEGRPGPVLIDIPKNVQLETIEINTFPEITKDKIKPGIGSSEIENIKQAAELINKSKKPVLYIGGGTNNSEKYHLIKNLAEKNSIPVCCSLMGLGAFDPSSDLYLGMLGMHAKQSTNICIDNADLLIALGARFDDRATGKVDEFCKHASIIHIDIDQSEFGKIKQPHCCINSDLGEALEKIIPLLEKNKRTSWIDFINDLKNTYSDILDSDENEACFIINKIAESADKNAIITTDVGQHQMWIAQYYPFTKPRSFLTSGGLGTMGFGLPAAIGAALEFPERQVLCFSGDGSFLMNIQELACLKELGLNIKIFILNNSSLGLVRQQQELFYNANFSSSVFHYNPDFLTIAKGFGINSYNIEKPHSAESELNSIINEDGPALINIKIKQSENVFPMVAPGAANRDMIIKV